MRIISAAFDAVLTLACLLLLIEWTRKVLAWVARRIGQRLRARAERRLGPPIFASGGRVPGGAVTFRGGEFWSGEWDILRPFDQERDLPEPAAPDLLTSPALSAAAVDESGEPAFTLDGCRSAILETVRFGKMMRRCDECGAEHTDIEVDQYAAVHDPEGGPGDLMVMCIIEEACNGCGAQGSYKISPLALAASRAASAMAQAELAMEGLRAELGQGPFS